MPCWSPSIVGEAIVSLGGALVSLGGCLVCLGGGLVFLGIPPPPHLTKKEAKMKVKMVGNNILLNYNAYNRYPPDNDEDRKRRKAA